MTDYTFHQAIPQFKELSLTDPRLRPDVRDTFAKINQLIGWELVQGNRTFTGLVIDGEKNTPEGSQPCLACRLDSPNGPPISLVTSKAISDIVMRAFERRS